MFYLYLVDATSYYDVGAEADNCENENGRRPDIVTIDQNALDNLVGL